MTQKDFNDFKEFINKLLYERMSLDDYEIIMNRLGIPRPIKNNSETWMYKSFCHNIDLSKSKNNLAFYTETRKFYCFSECQVSYNLITLLEKRFELIGEKKSRFQCVKWVCEQLNIPFSFKSDVCPIKNDIYNWQNGIAKYIRNKNQEIELKIYDKSVLDYFDKQYHQSWIDDNISIETMEKYGIRYYSFHDSIVIPCFDKDGNLCGIRERFLNPNAECKYMPLTILDGSSFAFPVARTLYGLNYNANNIEYYKKAVLFEAEKSTLQTNTYFGCKNYSVSLYGKSMSKEKAKQLLELGVEEIIIALDFDYEKVFNEDGTFTKEFESFKRNVYRIGDYFKGHCMVTAIVEYNEHPKNCSPSDLGKNKYLDLFNNRENLYD